MLSFIFATFATMYTFLLNNRVYCAGGFSDCIFENKAYNHGTKIRRYCKRCTCNYRRVACKSVYDGYGCSRNHTWVSIPMYS